MPDSRSRPDTRRPAEPERDGTGAARAVRRTGPGAGAPPAGLAALQAGAGNAAVVQMLRRSGHAWAQEQHQHSAGCGHQDTGRAGAEQPQVQRSAVHDVLGTPGRPMDGAVRSDMEARLGADFSDVRIHADAAAKASAAEVGARAYTSGNHVVIGEGGGDKHTLAHELTHVIQQRRGPVAGTDTGSGLRVSDPGDRFEREAEANATRVMQRRVVQRAPADPGASGGEADARTSLPQGAEGVAVQRMNNPGPAGQNPGPAGQQAGPAGQQAVPAAQQAAPVVPPTVTFPQSLVLDGADPDDPTPAFPKATFLMGLAPEATVLFTGQGTPGEAVALEAVESQTGALLGMSQQVALDPTGNTVAVSLAGLPDLNTVGRSLHLIQWRLVRADGSRQDAGVTRQEFYRPFGVPTTAGLPRARAVREAVTMAAGQTDAHGVAVALRQAIRARITYNPADPINDDPLTVLTDGMGVCTDFGNLHVHLAQAVGLQANAAKFWGGFMYQGQNVWVSNSPNQTTLTNVRATDIQYHPNQGVQGWDFTYHAIARINGILHDAALNREGIDAAAVHEGLQVAYRDMLPGLLPQATAGQAYAGYVPRQLETVAVNVRDYGDRISGADFNGRVLQLPPGTPSPHFDPVLVDPLGTLPPGLTLDPTGLITGTPTIAGTYSFMVAPVDNIAGAETYQIEVV